MTVRMVVGGDAMLGRLVGKSLMRRGPGWPLGQVSGLFREADIALVNLECAITSSREIWPGAPKAFYFGAPESALKSLTGAGIDIVSLANNHLLDFGYPGMKDTLTLLDGAGIAHAGAGNDLDAASSPARLEKNGIRFALAAYCDHQEDFSAQPGRPGIRYIDLADERSALDRFEDGLHGLSGAHWPILSLHWGPNEVERPSPAFMRLARGAIGMGYAMVYGHSAHVFHGVEFYRGRPIFYSCGDLVDDYQVDPVLRNDRQVVFEIVFGRDSLREVRFHPVVIEDCRTCFASGEAREWIVLKMRERCSGLGTVVIDGDPPRLQARGAR